MSTHFVEVKGGKYVNLNHVAYLKPTVDRNRSYMLFGPNDDLFGTTHPGFDLDCIEGELIPAAPGAEVVLVTTYSEAGDHRAMPDTTDTSRIPVLAWRVTKNMATPYYLEPPASNQTALFLMPDGTLLDPAIASYADLDTARQRILKDAQATWFAEQARSTKSGERQLTVANSN